MSTPSTSLPTALLQWRQAAAGSQFVGAFAEATSLAIPLIPQPTDRSIAVEVNLSAGGVSSGWVALPPQTIQIPAIPIPTLTAFFDDVFFNANPHDSNGTLILLPVGSPVTQSTDSVNETARSTLATALDVIQGAVEGLVANQTSTPGYNPFNPLAPLVSILGSLKDDLNVRKLEVHWAKADAIPFLGTVAIHSNGSAQDRISCMLLLAPPGSVVHCYNNANFDPSAGAFDVMVGNEMAVAVPSLVPSEPPTVPPGHLTVVVPRSTFNDVLSSVQLVKAS